MGKCETHLSYLHRGVHGNFIPLTAVVRKPTNTVRLRYKTTKSSSWGFPLKVWLLTVLVAPFVFIGALAVVRSAPWSDVTRSARVIPPLMMFGLLLLLPVLLLYGLVFWLLRYRPLSHMWKWLLLSAAGVVAIWTLYFFYDRSFFAEGGFGVYSWPLSYSLVLVTAGGLLRMPGK